MAWHRIFFSYIAQGTQTAACPSPVRLGPPSIPVSRSPHSLSMALLLQPLPSPATPDTIHSQATAAPDAHTHARISILLVYAHRCICIYEHLHPPRRPHHSSSPSPGPLGSRTLQLAIAPSAVRATAYRTCVPGYMRLWVIGFEIVDTAITDTHTAFVLASPMPIAHCLQTRSLCENTHGRRLIDAFFSAFPCMFPTGFRVCTMPVFSILIVNHAQRMRFYRTFRAYMRAPRVAGVPGLCSRLCSEVQCRLSLTRCS